MIHSGSNLSIGSSLLPYQSNLSLAAFSAASAKVIQDFLETNNSAIAIEDLKLLDASIYHDTFVVKAIRSVLNSTEEIQARLASFLTVAYDANLLTRPQVTRAFEKLIQIAESLRTDVENVEDKLFSFFAVAVDDHVVDEAFLFKLPEALLRQLSPALLQNEPYLQGNLELLKVYKQKCADFMPEFFNCGEVEMVKQFFAEVRLDILSNTQTKAEMPSIQSGNESVEDAKPVTGDLYKHEWVRRLLAHSLERTNTQKEMVSQTLSSLCGSGENDLSLDDIQLGVLRLLATLHDLSLDCPKVSDIVSKFIVRMTVDDILPPAFVSDLLRLRLGEDLAVETLRRAFKWMTDSARHHLLAEKFKKVWTGTDGHRPEVEMFKRELRDVILELFDTGDIHEAVDAFNQLDMAPDQEIEAIRKTIVFAMDRQEREWGSSVDFLEALVLAGEIDAEVIQKGFQDVLDKISDIELDCPNAKDMLKRFFVVEFVSRGLLAENFVVDF